MREREREREEWLGFCFHSEKVENDGPKERTQIIKA